MAIDPHPPHQPYPYGGPPPGYYPPAYVRVVPTSGMATASLICGLLGLITFGLLSIAGVICGHIALTETRTGERGGHGLAVAGLIISWLQTGGWLLFWAFMIFGTALGAAGR